MKKRIIAILFAFVFCFCAAAPAFASDSDGFADEYYRLNDLADILSDSEEEELLATLDEISVRQKMDVTIAIVDDLNGYGSATECAAQDFFSSTLSARSAQPRCLLRILLRAADIASISLSIRARNLCTSSGVSKRSRRRHHLHSQHLRLSRRQYQHLGYRHALLFDRHHRTRR